jgi:hypothetical protein
VFKDKIKARAIDYSSSLITKVPSRVEKTAGVSHL